MKVGTWPRPVYTERTFPCYSKGIPFFVTKPARPEITAWRNPFTTPLRYLRGLSPSPSILAFTYVKAPKPAVQLIRFDQKLPISGIVWPANPALIKRED